jgi:hypothetical protein
MNAFQYNDYRGISGNLPGVFSALNGSGRKTDRKYCIGNTGASVEKSWKSEGIQKQ